MNLRPPFPKFVLPGDALDWMRASDVESCEPVDEVDTDAPPGMALVRKADPAERLMRVWAARMADGLHYFVTVSPGVPGSVMHLAIRNRPIREAKMSATAAIAAPLALRHYRVTHSVSLGDEAAWMKKAHAQILKALEKHGAEALTGMGPVFLELTRQCMQLVDKALGRDVDDAIMRVRKDFLFLVDRISEDDVVRLWREVIVEKTHDH
jgi:hypothetical protein